MLMGELTEILKNQEDIYINTSLHLNAGEGVETEELTWNKIFFSLL